MKNNLEHVEEIQEDNNAERDSEEPQYDSFHTLSVTMTT
jgi:hypothetical protein